MYDLDASIALELARAKVITFRMLEVWTRMREGVLPRQMRHDYPKQTGNGNFCESTLYKWAAAIDVEIDIQKSMHRRENAGRFSGHTVASGSHTRRAGDPTQGHHMPTDQSSWDEETLKRYGVLDRWSRKRERRERRG